MNPINSLIIEGTCTGGNDFEILSPTMKRITFCVGVDRYVKDENDEMKTETSYFDVRVFGRMAEIMQQKMKPGLAVRVVGRLKQETIMLADDKCYNYVYIIGEHIEFRK